VKALALMMFIGAVAFGQIVGPPTRENETKKAMRARLSREVFALERQIAERENAGQRADGLRSSLRKRKAELADLRTVAKPAPRPSTSKKPTVARPSTGRKPAVARRPAKPKPPGRLIRGDPKKPAAPVAKLKLRRLRLNHPGETRKWCMDAIKEFRKVEALRGFESSNSKRLADVIDRAWAKFQRAEATERRAVSRVVSSNEQLDRDVDAVERPTYAYKRSLLRSCDALERDVNLRLRSIAGQRSMLVKMAESLETIQSHMRSAVSRSNFLAKADKEILRTYAEQPTAAIMTLRKIGGEWGQMEALLMGQLRMTDAIRNIVNNWRIR